MFENVSISDVLNRSRNQIIRYFQFTFQFYVSFVVPYSEIYIKRRVSCLREYVPKSSCTSNWWRQLSLQQTVANRTFVLNARSVLHRVSLASDVLHSMCHLFVLLEIYILLIYHFNCCCCCCC
ncbi:hypothetical protein NP493_676g01001 [Ridgeia piscesae]|uniref:Uncharacterized protein n=1 Tax=Ridgeia piscesae TaxID=27915 RepID=A0AAD9NMW9_RIDPI|nr:hypothetical protein NP493_676g01001 [Ridgeia piscesae]